MELSEPSDSPSDRSSETNPPFVGRIDIDDDDDDNDDDIDDDDDDDDDLEGELNGDVNERRFGESEASVGERLHCIRRALLDSLGSGGDGHVLRFGGMG